MHTSTTIRMTEMTKNSHWVLDNLLGTLNLLGSLSLLRMVFILAVKFCWIFLSCGGILSRKCWSLLGVGANRRGGFGEAEDVWGSFGTMLDDLDRRKFLAI